MLKIAGRDFFVDLPLLVCIDYARSCITMLCNMGENMIKIESGISIGKHGPKYPFSEMKVGDSFLVDSDFHAARASANYYAAKLEMKFKTKKVYGGLRIWRVA